MSAYFGIAKGKHGCTHIPRLGEVCMYERDTQDQIWDIRIGDGKTQVKDLPPLANYDIYTRVANLEEEIKKLKNDRRI